MAEKKETARKKRKKWVIIILCALLFFGFLYGRNIIKLKAQNAALRKQQEELIAERNENKKKLKNINSKEFIKEEARRQLRLLNPGEIMFLFKEAEDKGDKTGGDE